MSTDEMILYALFAVMVVVAILFIVPTLTKVGDAQRANQEGEEHKAQLGEALREAMTLLKDEKARGTLSDEEYARMADDIERRAVEEVKQVTVKESGRSFSPAVVISGVVATIVFIAAAGYLYAGSPELMRLHDSQLVLEGKATVEQLELYLKNNHRDGRAWVLLARQRAEKGDIPGAIEAYRTGREVMDKVRADPTVALELSAALLANKTQANLREALPLLQDIHGVQPGDVQVTQMLVVAAMELEEWKIGADALEELLGTMSPDQRDYLEVRELLSRLRRLEQEKASTKAAPASKP